MADLMRFRNILLIDDDDDDHEIFLTAIKDLPASIKFQGLNNATDAFNKLVEREITPDTIFLDLNMPLMDGIQFLSLLKKTEELKNIPVIIYSTSSHSGAINRAKELGAQDFITKPDNYEDLVNILKEILC
jgi:CheY-like chemotaxis protein